MPNLKSAKKRLRQTERRTVTTTSRRTRVKTESRRFVDAVNAGEPAALLEAYKGFCSALDKAAKTGVIKKGNAVRRKARAAIKVRALAQA